MKVTETLSYSWTAVDLYEVRNLPSINAMRPVVLGVIYHVCFGVCDEPESTGPLCFRILHNDDIHNFSPFFEMRF